MIVPMTKYDIVLHHASYGEFLERLRELGLVDVTTTGWEPSDDDRALMAAVEQARRAVARLSEMEPEPGAEPYATGAGAMDEYRRMTASVENLAAQAARLRKEAAETRVWGEFSPEIVGQLLLAGVGVRFYAAYERDFARRREEWSERYHIEPVATINGMVYFVVLAPPLAEIDLEAQEFRLPESSYTDLERRADGLDREAEGLQRELGRAAASLDKIRAYMQEQAGQLDFLRVSGSGRGEADGSLKVLEGWATRESAVQVDAFLESQPGVVCLKSAPTPEDDTPVLLRNNKFARLFELIGDLYSLPRYGTMDLTRYFAPFYMLFFAFCLGDGGYGLLLLAAGLLLKLKGGPKMQQAAMLTMLCGGATVVFGVLTASFFGIKFGEIPAFAEWQRRAISTDNLFPMALALGFVQLLFAMALKAVARIRQFGFKYALSTLGWIVVLLAGGAAFCLPDLGVPFTMQSPAFLCALAMGLLLMLFANSPGKNPLVNFGNGLWNTYNDVIGFAGDLLSYIRLFAIGISGGTLALVFNDVAFGLSPDIPVVKQLVVVLILLIGHGINLFMSVLSAFVHPLRLTFLEFYKNADFDGTQRAFTPFRKNK